MSGGAPRSMLAHLTIVKAAGYEVLATIDEDYEELSKLVNDTPVIKIKNFRAFNPFDTIKTIVQWIKLLNTHKPSLIYSNSIPQSKFLSIIADLSGTPLVYAQAGGVARKDTLKIMTGTVPVAYSAENKRVFLEAGFANESIHVISNRISQSAKYSIYETRIKEPDSIRVLITGNIKSFTINGYLNFLSSLKERRRHIKKQFNVIIAGKDVSGNNKYQQSIIEMIDDTNDIIKGLGAIAYPCWVDNIQAIQAKSDIIIGKGRSVIEPAMKAKVCFVLAESGVLTRISPDSFHSLYEYNFSGRGSQKDNTNDFFQILEKGIMPKFYQDAQEASLLIQKEYLVDFAQEKLERAFSDALKTKKHVWPFRLGSATKKLLLIYLLAVKTRLINK